MPGQVNAWSGIVVFIIGSGFPEHKSPLCLDAGGETRYEMNSPNQRNE